MSQPYEVAENWTENDLITNMPSGETDLYEFKGSAVTENDLKKKIPIAASAFWNSGGGFFIAGVDDAGNIDGGIFDSVRRQKIRDWVDQLLLSVSHIGPYTINTIHPIDSTSQIQAGKIVLVVAFGESPVAPHMAPDKKYYIRSGAHSNPANHFLIESVRARSGLQYPMLKGLIQRHATKSAIRELVIFTVNDRPALDVSVTLDPLPPIFEKFSKDQFPLSIPVIDQSHPFHLDLYVKGSQDEMLGTDPIELVLKYQDILGQSFDYRQPISLSSIAPIRMGKDDEPRLYQLLEKVCNETKGIREAFETYFAQSLKAEQNKFNFFSWLGRFFEKES